MPFYRPGRPSGCRLLCPGPGRPGGYPLLCPGRVHSNTVVTHLASLPFGNSSALGIFTPENSANTLGIFLFLLQSKLLAPHRISGKKDLSLQARCWSSEQQDTDQPWVLESEVCVFEE